MTDKYYVLAKRFVRAFVAGATGVMIPLLAFDTNGWADIGAWVSRLLAAGMVGGITGVILALDKWARWHDEPEQETPEVPDNVSRT